MGIFVLLEVDHKDSHLNWLENHFGVRDEKNKKTKVH